MCHIRSTADRPETPPPDTPPASSNCCIRFARELISSNCFSRSCCRLCVASRVFSVQCLVLSVWCWNGYSIRTVQCLAFRVWCWNSGIQSIRARREPGKEFARELISSNCFSRSWWRIWGLALMTYIVHLNRLMVYRV